ncbi:Multisubstrate pseudouridine synthase 7 [Glycine soja]
MAMKTAEEHEVGISCFISDLRGFRGILKQRYSDFIVNEVDRDGAVVQLSSLDAPLEEPEENRTNTHDTVVSYASQIESFKSLAEEYDAILLEEFINKINAGGEDSVSPIVLSPDSDKSHRKAMHNFFKENFKFLVTDVVNGPDASSKCIRVRLNSAEPNNKGKNSKKRKERDDKPFDSRGSENWPENVGKFLRFHLYKENKDTHEALGVIGNMLSIQPKSFGFAGTKDKRAVTTQRVTVYKQQASRLASLNKRLFGIKLGDFCYVKEGLCLGQLLGNRFTITLRFIFVSIALTYFLRGIVADSEDIIKASADALGRHGFINYFGLQKSAIAKARKYYKESSDVVGTLKQLPRYLVAERAVLQTLKTSPGNYLQALKSIPRTLRMLYVHSYQSYLWNHAASKRVQKYGTENVVSGDLVYCKENSTGKVTEFVGSEYAEDCRGRYDSNNEDEVSGEIHEEINSVKVIDAEDLNSGCYTIDDVILPMPGSRVKYPTNHIANVYEDLAKKDGISLTESVHNVEDFSITSITGCYRRVFQKPINFEWELLSYSDSSEQLVDTDLDKINKSKPMNTVKQMGAANGKNEEAFDCIRELESSDDIAKVENYSEILGEEVKLPHDESLIGSSSQDSQIALKLSFTLPASCYATMAIRELLKTSTSVAYHKTLNQ